MAIDNEQVKYPQIVVPFNTAPLTPETLAKGEKTTTMIFDKPVHLTIESNRSVEFPAGVHEVPTRLADHWYLKAHNVRPYAKPVNVGGNGNTPRGHNGRNRGNQ
jgi:hypothetical protein